MTSPLGTPNEIIRVLVADDSPLSRQIIGNLINEASDMRMVGEAATGIEAVRLNHSLKPHIIAMDINMPVLDGLKATRLIMQEHPTRVVILGSAMQIRDRQLSEQVTAAGAVDFCEKPDRQADQATADSFIKTLRAMSRVGVIRRSRAVEPDMLGTVPDYPGIRHRPEIVLIVSSTGGPHALETIIKALPGSFPLPIVIVQHISDEFVDNMTGWLDKVTPLNIKMAESGERPLPGNIYIAPIGVHLRITFNGRFSLEPDTENRRHIPSGDVLLESAAEAYGSSGIGVVLTGMGMDGAHGLTRMRSHGAHTIVQDEATSIVFGMPKAAIDLGGGEYITPLEDIAGLLMKLATEDVEDT